jgi:hypothetical protein
LITQLSNPHAKTLIPEKPSKSGFIGICHNENLSQDTSTIGIKKPPPNEYQFANEKYIENATRSIIP